MNAPDDRTPLERLDLATVPTAALRDYVRRVCAERSAARALAPHDRRGVAAVSPHLRERLTVDERAWLASTEPGEAMALAAALAAAQARERAALEAAQLPEERIQDDTHLAALRSGAAPTDPATVAALVDEVRRLRGDRA